MELKMKISKDNRKLWRTCCANNSTSAPCAVTMRGINEILDDVETLERVLSAVPEQGLTDESLKTYARARADECYLDMIAQARTDACCGWEYKAQCGEFGPREFEAHKKAAEHYGKHLAYADIAVVLSRHPSAAPEPDSAFGTMVDEARIPQPAPQDDAAVVEETK
jgi:hypothetical protein